MQNLIDRLDRFFRSVLNVEPRQEDKKTGELTVPRPDWSTLPAEDPHEDDREYGDAVGCIESNSPYFPYQIF